MAIYRTIGYKQELKQTFIIPLISGVIMSILTFLTYFLFTKFAPDKLALFVAIFIAVIVYFTALILLKGINEYDLSLIPFGSKIYAFLYKLGIYKDEL